MAVISPSPPSDVALALQRLEQGQGKGRVPVLMRPRAKTATRQLVRRLLVMRGGGNHLPCRILHEPIEPLLVDDLGHADDVAGRRPAKRAGEATVHDDQRVTHGQREQRVVHQGHEQVRVLLPPARILRQQVAVRPVIAVQRDAVTGEIENQAIIGAEFLGQPVRQQFGEALARRVLVDEKPHVEAVCVGQNGSQAPRIVGGGLEWRHAVSVVVDADNDGDATSETTGDGVRHR